MTRAAATLIVLCATGAATGAQQLPPRDSSRPVTADASAGIGGVVTAADGGAPIRGAEIVLRGGTASPNARPPSTISDAEGRYEIRGLSPGSYTITASKTGYVALAYGQTRPRQQGRTIQLAASEIARNVDIALPRGAVIVVRVADLYGDPAPGYRVIAYQPAFTGGTRTLTPVGQGPGLMFSTDDRGEFRLSGLAPGEYIVGATPAGANATIANPRGRDPQTFYPGTVVEADAQPVFVGLGEEVSIAFQMAAGVRSARISGVIHGTARPTEVRMMRRSLGGNSLDSITPAPDGRFTAPNLTPGEYTLVARNEKESGSLTVQVAGEDQDGLLIDMRPAVTVKGHFSFDGAMPPSGRWTQFRVGLPNDLGLTTVSNISNNWTFEVSGLSGTGVLRLQQPPSDWFLKAVLVDGKDMTDTPTDFRAFEGKAVEVVITQRFAEVTGSVVDARDRAVGDYVAVVFPEDAAQWTTHSRFILSARPDQNGRFTIPGLGPGPYLVRAVAYLQPGQEREPATLERLRAGATRVALTEGQSETVSLTLTP